jgi:hypothetical protein
MRVNYRNLPSQQSLRSGGKKDGKKAVPTSGGGLKEFGKDLARSAKRVNSNLRTARKYVTEDVKRRVTGKPTQREERERSDSKVAKMRKTETATKTKRGGKYKRLMEKK